MTKVDEYSPYWSIEDNLLIQNDGRVSGGFMIKPAEMESLSYEDYQSINEAFNQLLISLPVGTVYQKIDDFDEAPFNSLDHLKGKSYLDRKILMNYEGRQLNLHTSVIFLSFSHVKEPRKSNAVNNYFTIRKMFGENVKKDIEKRKVEANDLLKTERVKHEKERKASICCSWNEVQAKYRCT